jgi:hypothetical protein
MMPILGSVSDRERGPIGVNLAGGLGRLFSRT